LCDLAADQHQVARPIQAVPEHEIVKELALLRDRVDDHRVRRADEARNRHCFPRLGQIVALHRLDVFIENAA